MHVVDGVMPYVKLKVLECMLCCSIIRGVVWVKVVMPIFAEFERHQSVENHIIVRDGVSSLAEGAE